MKEFMGRDFLLDTPASRTLYHEAAREMPILDYHCHLSPREIFENKAPETICDLWFSGDHYKWRLLRACGCPEPLLNGKKDKEATFLWFARALELSPGNPLVHWANLELQQYFGIEEPLNSASAKRIWNSVNQTMQSGDFRPQSLISASRVTALCTTDDPADDLFYHKGLRSNGYSVKVLPTFRPDRAMQPTAPDYRDYLDALGQSAGIAIVSFGALKEALARRLDAFQELGCRVSDHSLSTVPFAPAPDSVVEQIFQKVWSGQAVTPREEEQFRTALLLFLGRGYHARGWAMELHIGALRNNSSRLLSSIGADAGGDAIGDAAIMGPLSRLLDAMDADGKLPKTVLFHLNPKDSLPMAALMGCFQDGSLPGKVQYGPAWWFLDTKRGIEEHLCVLAEQGTLGAFIGMETDSRSFTSYARHTYFRRILCRVLGRWMEEGEADSSMDRMKQLVRGVCYDNAAAYFSLA